ncbi:uncharacterized protein BYT42DRAFT_516755 [Radiomyces spectabilis]|uniref:uncharacterized protein n=1 Tax=Radiomyces spectabilis TaxID=64574 RepID=UPI002220DFCB|nr:uncharacterized protein BYT42DRAFT_516755 [Radiomyces spectabilis]KAI8376036.1 hypothetical protein BYT42DRAFT_516755 [Radiomyces spectabilis]
MPRSMEPITLARDPLPHVQLSTAPKIKKRFSPHFLYRPRPSTPTEEKAATPKLEEKTASWETTLERCIKSIVSIKATRVRALDTETPGVFTATGFIVDAERGILLSNRHVVSVAPIVAQAVLCNYEEIELTPIYRDPVHDFGFFRYDPSKVQFVDIPGIELYPEGAAVGQEIRVVGNDAGEKLSILSGTLARLDREAPDYGLGSYNDFNTFYLQAASGTSAGSSGSPVLDMQGRAVALNAGGASRSSSSYYLPLDRVKRALQLIQRGEPVPRGTLQAEFQFRSYDELARLGLEKHMEQRLRSRTLSSGETNQGLLVVKAVTPKGPAHGLLEPGDILLTVQGCIVPYFSGLADLLDNAVDQKIHVVIARAGQLCEKQMTVQDLHSITPHRYLEFGGGMLSDFSYQMARSYGLAVKDAGVYVGSAGYILGAAYAMRKSVIVGLNNQPVHNLDDFIRIVRDLRQGDQVPIRYYSLSRALKDKVMIVLIDHRWHKFRLATRNDVTGMWDYTDLGQPKLPLEPKIELHGASSQSKVMNNNVYKSDAQQHATETEQGPIERLTKSLVSVDCFPPYVIDGLQNSHSFGAGFVVSLDPPLIICDRDTVPVAMCRISLTFNNALKIPGELLFLHPFYNYAVVTFDITQLNQAAIEVHPAEFSDQPLTQGSTAHYIGLGGDDLPIMKEVTVSSITPVRTKEATPARWRAVNVEAARAGDIGGQGGLLADAQGKVQGYWMSFATESELNLPTNVMAGLPSELMVPVIERLRSGQSPSVRGLPIDCWTMQLANARLLGLSDIWLQRLNRHKHVVYVMGLTDLSSECAKFLKTGDIILEINGDLIVRISDLAKYSQEQELNMTILRDGKEMTMTVPTTLYPDLETTRVIGWQGMYIQEAHMAAKEQLQEEIPEGVYVSCCLFGSPAEVSLIPGIWITEVDQQRVKTMDDFLTAIRQHRYRQKIAEARAPLAFEKPQSKEAMWLLAPAKEDQQVASVHHDPSHIRVKYITRNNITHVSALKLDRHYWPTWQIQKDPSNPLGWRYDYDIA